MARTRHVAIALVVLLIVVSTGLSLKEPVTQRLFSRWATQPLDEDEQSALAQCEDPGWTGLIRVLHQDVPIDCSELWLAQTVAAHLDPRRARWVERQLDPYGPVRQRFRYGTAMLLAGHAAPSDWPFLVTDPEVGPGVRDEVIAAAVSGLLDPRALDPVLAEDYDRARFLQGDADGLDGVVRTLRRYASRPERASAEERARWTAAGLTAIGLPGDRLDVLLERHRHGLAWKGAPPGLVPLLANRGAVCSDRSSPACLMLVADLLEADRRATVEGSDGGPGGEEAPIVPAPRSVRALSEILDGSPGAVAATADTLGAMSAWIAAAPPEDRARRLLGAVAWPGSAWGIERARSGIAGDPIDVLLARGGSPWASAAAALALGEGAGIEVTVHSAGDGVRIAALDSEVYVGPCAGLRGLRAGSDAAWPAQAVAAQAALEASGAALRAGHGAEALRLATFAERLDPIGARDAAASVAGVQGAPPPEGILARAAGMDLAAPVQAPTGAEAERAERATAWSDLAAQWGRGPDLASCPSLLGP